MSSLLYERHPELPTADNGSTGVLIKTIRREDVKPSLRAAAGRALAKLSDPRFRADAWHLPDESQLGLLEIPAGSFLMGSDKDQDPMAYGFELPQHEITLPLYYIARYPVTVAQFRAFVGDSGHQPEDSDSLQGVDTHPVVWVSWYEALKYCQWLTEGLRQWEETPVLLKTLLRERGWVITLPSEAEWEKAARGTDGRVFPWGNKADLNRANYNMSIGTTSVVGSFPGGASPYGVEDLSGNVWEWTRSVYESYPYDSRDGREDLEAGQDMLRVLRGGGFNYDAGSIRCTHRDRSYPHLRNENIGFRVVMVPPDHVSIC